MKLIGSEVLRKILVKRVWRAGGFEVKVDLP